MNRLQSGGSKNDVTPETKPVVEDLSGYNYSPNIHFLNA
ncbi:hypothetical protein BCD91_003068 [Clostridium beijerinckii]|nr:hypothetical protein [Clostridium beijerinckii]